MLSSVTYSKLLQRQSNRSKKHEQEAHIYINKYVEKILHQININIDKDMSFLSTRFTNIKKLDNISLYKDTGKQSSDV